MTRCACGAETEGEPWANGWARFERIDPGMPSSVAWQCPACAGADISPELRWSFADAVAWEERLP